MSTTLLVEIEGTTLEVGVMLLAAPVVNVSASNTGLGEGVFRSQAGSNLQFKSITATGAVVSSSADEINIAVPSAPVDSVNAQTGAVSLDTDDVPEGGANLYYSDGRVNANGNVITAFNHAGVVGANPHGVTAALVGADPAGTANTAVGVHAGAVDPHPQYTTTVEAAAAAPVQTVNAQTGAVVLTAADVGADVVGAATSAIATHEAAFDPHPQYTTVAEAGAAAPVQSVNTQTGVVVLDATDVGADATGTAAAAVVAHEGALDPHPVYTTAVEAAAAAPVQSVNALTGAVVLTPGAIGAEVAGAAATAVAAHEAAPDPHPIYTTPAQASAAAPVQSVNAQAGLVVLDATDVGAEALGAVAAGVAAHEAAPDPHPIYTTTAEAGAAAPVQSVNALTGSVVITPALIGAEPAGTAAAQVAAHVALPDPHPAYTTTAEAAAVAPVQSVNAATGAVVLDATDVGADPVGTSAAGIAAHEAAPDPHPIYTTAAEAGAAAPVQSVNAQAGVVVLDFTDVGADAAGTSAAGIAAHEAAPDPHPQYTTAAEAAVAAPVQSVNGNTGVVVLGAVDVGADAAGTSAAGIAAHEAAPDPHPVYTTAAEASAAASAAVATHEGLADPHPVYTTAAEAAAAAPVQSVNGNTGAVVLSTTDIAEGTNLYYTEGRVSANVDVTANSAHRVNTANPHSTSIANIGSGTLAQLNTAVSDANLIPDTRAINNGYAITGGGNLTADRTLAVALTSSEATATATTSTSSTTYVALDSMTLTPGAGTYLALLHALVDHNATNSRVDITLFANGIEVTATGMSTWGDAVDTTSVSTMAVITVAGGQAIEGRWKVNGNTQDIRNRRLTLVRLS